MLYDLGDHDGARDAFERAIVINEAGFGTDDPSGHDGIRYSAARLHRQLTRARYEYVARQVAGEHALLVWKAKADHCKVEC